MSKYEISVVALGGAGKHAFALAAFDNSGYLLEVLCNHNHATSDEAQACDLAHNMARAYRSEGAIQG